MSARGARKGSPTRGGADMFGTPTTPRENIADQLDLLDKALKTGDSSRVAQLMQTGHEPPSLARLKTNIGRVRTSLDTADEPQSKTPHKAMSQHRLSLGAKAGKEDKSASLAALNSEGVPLRIRYDELQTRYDALEKKYDEISTESEKAMETNIRRITKLNEQIADLQGQLRSATSKRTVAPTEIIDLNGKIQDGVSALQQRTARVLKEHELDLIRSFRTRLLDVQRELHMERSRQDEAALEWIERAQTLTKKLDWAKEEALRLDGLNQLLTRENNRLRTQYSAQEGDHQYSAVQTAGLKRKIERQNKEIQALKDQLTNAGITPNELGDTGLQSPLMGSMTSRTSPSIRGLRTPMSTLRPLTAESPEPSATLKSDSGLSMKETEKWKDEVRRLRKLLETERANLRKSRSSYVASLADKTDLQAFLRQCISDVQAEIVAARRVSDPASRSRADPAEFSAQERSRTLELLLSKERVVNLLYDRTFPSKYTARASSKSENATDRLIDQLESAEDINGADYDQMDDDQHGADDYDQQDGDDE